MGKTLRTQNIVVTVDDIAYLFIENLKYDEMNFHMKL